MADPLWRVEVLPDGIVRAATFGGLDEDQARAYLGELQARFASLPEPLRILGDARRSGRHTPAARRLLRENMLLVPPGYMAILGSGLRVRLWVRMLAHNSLLRDVRFFAREEDALAWLRSIPAEARARQTAR
ncbi:MAG TPA: STAS/SEC14 domain-containing protein [Candidatus Thermoplasmatota archaeon]|nr:STAS/SEC14 domain-containing protein [Candidatus Thermoplasmatota archaeon]